MKQPPYKSFTDPVHGFIDVPKGPIMDVLSSPEVQRLRRIRQLGVGHMVFPGAEHSRFGHALGAMALMGQVLSTIVAKGTRVSGTERTAALIAALLHDIGHGPFSHTLEHTLIRGFAHEQMSRELIVRIAGTRGEPFDLALNMFDNNYERRFFHELISSQLDMDRLDYLRRDTYYTGVAEGAVGVDRIVRNLRVFPEGDGGRIVVERKGLHSIENFLMARRLMYWQVYLHRAVVAGDRLLRAALDRARHLLGAAPADVRTGSPALCFFLEREVDTSRLSDDAIVEAYVALDDADILYSLKRWTRAADPILADLSRRFLSRRFPRITFVRDEPTPETVAELRRRVRDSGVVPETTGDRDPVDYYFAVDSADHSAYRFGPDSILVLDASENVHELSETTDAASVHALTSFEKKWYVCLPKEVATLDVLEPA